MDPLDGSIPRIIYKRWDTTPSPLLPLLSTPPSTVDPLGFTNARTPDRPTPPCITIHSPTRASSTARLFPPPTVDPLGLTNARTPDRPTPPCITIHSPTRASSTARLFPPPTVGPLGLTPARTTDLPGSRRLAGGSDAVLRRDGWSGAVLQPWEHQKRFQRNAFAPRAQERRVEWAEGELGGKRTDAWFMRHCVR